MGARIGENVCLHVRGPALLARTCIYIVLHNSDVNIAGGKARCGFPKCSSAVTPEAT